MKTWSVVVCVFGLFRWTEALRTQFTPDLSRALDCLRLTTPTLQLDYPWDAEAHVDEIRRALPWRPPTTSRGQAAFTYNIEDMWMRKVMGLWDDRTNGTRLADMFGPYVPIFAYFLQPWLANHMRYPPGMVEALRKVLRRDVPYVAISQNAEGLAGKHELNMSDYPNILVVSGGGYGNVAVPLFKTEADSPEHAVRSATAFLDLQDRRPDPSSRQYVVSFVGTLDHAPGKLRKRMREVVEDFTRGHPRAGQTCYYKGPDWRNVMLSSKFNLCPRGYGRTSFHLLETIQAGLIPIHIYSDIPWVPYPEIFSKLGFVTTLSGLPALLERLISMPDSEIVARELVIAKYARSHFTPDAVVGQLFDLLLWRNGGGDLRCQQFPATIRDADFPGPQEPRRRRV